MNDTAANTLRNRAAAAASRRKLQERLNQQEREEERAERARRLIYEALGVPTPLAGEKGTLPIDIDGLLFDVSQYGDVWRLNLLQVCIECSQLYATALNDLADLGEALEEGPSLCERCDA